MRPYALAAAVALLPSTFACGGSTPPPPSSSAPPAEVPAPATSAPSAPASTAPQAGPAPAPGERVEAEGLRILDREVGKGAEVATGDRVLVHYVGTLDDGTEFDSSRSRGKPFEVTIGMGMVIKGWDRGIVGMREGGKRRLVIPYQLAYGEEGRPPKIPAKAQLTFEIELLEVKNAKKK